MQTPRQRIPPRPGPPPLPRGLTGKDVSPITWAAWTCRGTEGRGKEEKGWGRDHWQAGRTLYSASLPPALQKLEKNHPLDPHGHPRTARGGTLFPGPASLPTHQEQGSSSFLPLGRGGGLSRGEKRGKRQRRGQEGWGHQEFRGLKASTRGTPGPKARPEMSA